MLERTLLIVLGGTLLIFELLFGAIAALDIAFLGISLMTGGGIHYYTRDWQQGLIVAVVLYMIYLIFIRSKIRKKALRFLQHIGIDVIVGKAGILLKETDKKAYGLVLIDGETWRARSNTTLKDQQKIIAVRITNNDIVWVEPYWSEAE